MSFPDTPRPLSRWVCTIPDHPWRDQPLASATPVDDASAPPDSAPETDAALRLTGTRHQTWEGFGGCFNELGWNALAVLDPDARAAVLDALFAPDADDGCRFTLARLPIGASDYAAEWYSLNEHDGDLAMEHFSVARDRGGLLPYVQAALTRRPELTLFASPWSPPTWMKHPRAYNYGTLRWEPDILAAYALYFARFVEAYAAEGVRVAAVHVQNEPDSDQKFPSCVWTGEKMRDFIRDHLGPLFRDRGLWPATEIWAGTIERAEYHLWAETILSDPGARAFVAGVGYQWAGKGSVQQTAVAWPELRLLQTENECGDGQNTWAYAGYVWDLLWHYLTNGVHGYCYWNMVLAPGGRSTWGWTQNAMFTVDPATREVVRQPEFYVMAHLARFVQPGAVRLGVTGPMAANALAFENPGGQTVVALRNPFPQARDCRLGPHHRLTLPGDSLHTLVF